MNIVTFELCVMMYEVSNKVLTKRLIIILVLKEIYHYQMHLEIIWTNMLSLEVIDLLF